MGGTGPQLTSDIPRNLRSRKWASTQSLYKVGRTRVRRARACAGDIPSWRWSARNVTPPSDEPASWVPATGESHTRFASFAIAKAAWLEPDPLRRPDRIQSGHDRQNSTALRKAHPSRIGFVAAAKKAQIEINPLRRPGFLENLAQPDGDVRPALVLQLCE